MISVKAEARADQPALSIRRGIFTRMLQTKKEIAAGRNPESNKRPAIWPEKIKPDNNGADRSPELSTNWLTVPKKVKTTATSQAFRKMTRHKTVATMTSRNSKSSEL